MSTLPMQQGMLGNPQAPYNPLYPPQGGLNGFMNSPGMAMAGSALNNMMQMRRGMAPQENPFVVLQEQQRRNAILQNQRYQQIEQKKLRDMQMQKAQLGIEQAKDPAWKFNRLKEQNLLPEGMEYQEYLASPYSTGVGASSKAFAPTIGTVGGKKVMLMPTYDPASRSMVMKSQELPDGWVEDSGIERMDMGDRYDLYRKSDAFFLGSKKKNLAPDQTPEHKHETAVASEQGKQSVQVSGDMFSNVGKIDTSISNLSAAIDAVDAGAGTGMLERYMPSVKAASIELDNIRNNMGLDIVGAGSFGALSESELEFALATALPTGLDGPELRDWLTRKREAQRALRGELYRAAMFLNSGGTLGELMGEKAESEGYISDDGTIREVK